MMSKLLATSTVPAPSRDEITPTGLGIGVAVRKALQLYGDDFWIQEMPSGPIHRACVTNSLSDHRGETYDFVVMVVCERERHARRDARADDGFKGSKGYQTPADMRKVMDRL